jgi:hypothetical protein
MAGYCAGYDVPGYANPGFGGGPGRGFGWGGGGGGWGWGRGFGGRRRGHGLGPGWAAWDPAFVPGRTVETERRALKARADALRAELRAVESRLAEDEEQPEKPE